MSGGSSVELGVSGNASVGTDEKTASTRAAWSQGNRWVGIARRLPSRSTNAIKTWMRNGVSHRRQSVVVRPKVRDALVLEGSVSPKVMTHIDSPSPESYNSYDSGYDAYDSGPTRYDSDYDAYDSGPARYDSGFASGPTRPQSIESGVEEPVPNRAVGLPGSPSQDGAARASTQENNISIAANPTPSDYSYPSDWSLTHSSIRDHDSIIGSGASSESDSSIYTVMPLPENDAWLTFAYAKHRMMVSLMSNVYATLYPHWRGEFRTRASSHSENTGASSQISSSSKSSSPGRGQKRIQDRTSHPPEDNDGKKRKTNPPKPGTHHPRRLFACCFHKNNAQKYCSNSDTGTKYRSCAGPGFSKISQLKQHLKRTHRAPIYCPRCWLVVESQAEMALHTNAQERCEQKEPQVQEGVNDDKMRMITETWGSSWEEIYEILFPGAPVPSPYYEEDDLLLETLEPASPRSQELRDFDTYNRTTLPLLVEANLQAIVESQIAPIEERVRAMVVDIVRTCQLTVARNYQLTIAPASLANDRTQSSTQTISSTENIGQMDGEPTQAFRDGTTGLEFFHEPSYLNAEASASFPGPMYNHGSVTGSQNPRPDSGYSSPPLSCSCSCHGYSNTWNTTNGRSSCQSCAYMHIDFDDFDSLQFL